MREPEIRACMLQVIADLSPPRPGEGNLQSASVLSETHSRLGGARDHGFQEAILTVFHELFRTGYLAWGFNLTNPNPPFFHVTAQGIRALSRISRDPANPHGYLQHLVTRVTLNPVAMSYLTESLACFTHDLPKASAVMIGCASESMVIELRDAIVSKLNALGKAVPPGLADWRIKTITDATFTLLQQQVAAMPRELRESLQSYWPAFLQQIRAARNDAGHPSSVEPVTHEGVHASLLIFPELCEWIASVRSWVNASLT